MEGVNGEDVPEWEKCKENVQPRKQGRNVGKLNTGLVARTETDAASKLKVEKEEYELALRLYEGDDPLSVWYNYVNWTEQNFPSGGKTSQLLQLLTACINQFNKRTEYYNDERYVQIWITFANATPDSVEVYKHMNSNTIGQKSAAFYRAWALCTEELGQTKMADQIYLQGIQAGATPIEDLKKARSEFETRTCRSLMQKMSTDDDETDQTSTQRQSLVSLASSSKGHVPHDRASAARPQQRAVLSQGTSKPQKTIQIFSDENDASGRSSSVSSSASKGRYTSLPDGKQHKENTQAPGKWNKPKKGSSSKSAGFSVAADFEVHEDMFDPSAATPSKPAAPVGTGLGLSVKKASKSKSSSSSDFRTHIITNFDEDEIIQELPMYNKNKVYAGVSEYSFEELRAIKWRQNLEKRNAEREIQRLEQEAAEALSKRKQTIEDQQAELAQQRRELRQFSRELQQEKISLREEMSRELKEFQARLEQQYTDRCAELLNAMESSCSLLSTKVERLEDEIQQLRAGGDVSSGRVPHTSANTTQRVTRVAYAQQGGNISTHSVHFKTPNDKNDLRNVSSKRHRTPDTSSAKRSLIKQSPSGVTQDCNQLMNGLFSQTLSVGNPLIEQTTSTHSIEMSGSEHHAAPERAAASGFEVFSEAPATVKIPAAGFSIFSDDKPTQSKQDKPAATFAVFSEEENKQQAMHIGTQPSRQSPVMAMADNSNPSPSQPTSMGAFSVFSDESRPQSAFKPPTAVTTMRKPQAASAFTVFSDENQPPPQPAKPVGSSAFSVYDGAEDQQPFIDKENMKHHMEADVKSTLTSVGGESIDYHTDFEMGSKFAEQARAMSTPFHPDSQATMSDLAGISEIKQKRPIARKSVQPIEFAPTQVLSPICERSKESNTDSSSSRNITSSGSSTNIGLTKSSFDMTRQRSTSTSSDNMEPAGYIDGHQGIMSAASTAAESYSNKSKLNTRQTEPVLDAVKEETGDLLQRATPVIDTTYYQPPELTEAQLNTTVYIDASNPFSDAVQNKLLRKIDLSTYEDVGVRDEAMPKLKIGSKLNIQGVGLKITGKLGIGGFATAFKAVVTDAPVTKSGIGSTTADTFNMSKLNMTQYNESDEVCVKLQKPACPWELYICRELRDRLLYLDDDVNRDILNRVMNVSHAEFYSDGSLMLNDLVSFGSLLNLVNAARCKRMRLHESLVMYITIELLHTVEVLHRCKMIHGDFKPDNILFMGFPCTLDEDNPFWTSSVKLIDFGRGIDMRKFPDGTTFTASNETEGFICIEMKTGCPWTYQTDLFGLLGTVYTLLFLDYMQVVYRDERWQPPTMKLPRGYRSKLWQSMFDTFLNIPSCDELPDISEWRENFEREFQLMGKDYTTAASQTNNMIGITKRQSL